MWQGAARPYSALLVAVLALGGVLRLEGVAGAGDTGQILQIPVRWCAIKGSPAADNPGGVGEPDTDNALWRRHERATDRVWFAQGTQISFRSAFTNDILVNASFPIIDDPSASPGQPGDILDPNTGNKSEYEAAKQACKERWDKLATQASLLGPIALNVRKLVKADGTESLQGYGEFSFTAASATANCANPPTGLQTAAGALAIADYSFLRAFDPDETILAHEFGHALGLEHGNGLDDNGNGRFDGFNNASYQGGCDPAENENAAPSSLMTPAVNAKVITALQRGKARAFGVVYSGAVKDPPAALIPGDTLADALVDAIHDVADATIDLTEVTVATHGPSQTAVFSHALLGLLDALPIDALNQYLVFADLDANPATGGAPATLDLGVPTEFQGAELVTRVLVSNPDGLSVVPTVWKFDGAAFVEITDPSIQASVDPALGGEVTQPQFDVVSIRMSTAVRGPAAATVRVQAFAQSLPPPPPPPGPSIAAVEPAPFDVVPDGPDAGSGGALALAPPQFPVCGVTPATARPGQAVAVEATGLFAGKMAKVILGDQMVGGGTTSKTGTLVQSFAVPFDAALGLRLVTVGIVGTALTADCALEVAGTPLTPIDVAIDVHPRSCPNPLNFRKRGSVPVAVLGSAAFDVAQVDAGLVRLEGIAPLRSSIADVATPFLPIVGRTGARDCTTAGPDGFVDLMLQFDSELLRAALGPATNGEVRVLRLTGNLKPAFGGTPISGEDVVVIVVR